ncbi:hypothetical protein [Sphingopyxis fribergensis]
MTISISPTVPSPGEHGIALISINGRRAAFSKTKSPGPIDLDLLAGYAVELPGSAQIEAILVDAPAWGQDPFI